MKTDNDIDRSLHELDKLNNSLYIPYDKSSNEVWKSIQQKIDNKPVNVRKLHFSKVRFIWAAASIALLAGLTLTLRFYHYTVKADPGKIASFYLPDGSGVSLAPQSEVTYYPLWWSVSRIVKLKGEAFFKVQKGEKFSVRSDRGITSVLGTSFDIYARTDNYRVVCYTGKVNVKARSGKHQIVLMPGEKAEINSEGEITFSKETRPKQYVAWINNQFVFTSTPITAVLNEVARRYNVTVTIDKSVHGSYTGNFPASIPVEQALSIVCKPFGLTFVKQNDTHYVVK